MIPKVYVNKISKDIKNNKNSYHFTNNERDIKPVGNIYSKINSIFNSEEFVYKSSVLITLKDGRIINEDIIALKDGEIVTLSNKKIKIEEIIDIKKAN